MRYVILLALILLAILYYRWRRMRLVEKKPQASDDQKPVRTVRCAQCGLVLPEKEAVRMNGEPFCSTKHARAWQESHRR